MSLRMGEKVALVLGNLHRQEGAAGQAQEQPHPKAKLCTTTSLGVFGNETHPSPTQHQGSTAPCGEHPEIFAWKMLARRTHWECPGLPAPFPSIPPSCWRAGGRDGTWWCHAGEENMLPPQWQCP